MKNQFKNRILIIIAIFISLSFLTTSCSNMENPTETNKQNSNVESSKDVSAKEQEVESSSDIPTIEQVITTLCSDEFEGRQTFSKGNEKAGEYIADIFNKIGLDRLSKDSYFQSYTQENGYSEEDDTSEIVQNVVGYIKGKDSEKAIVVSAHFDGSGIKEGEIHPSAMDNASGVSALIKIAEELKRFSQENAFESNIIFCAFNGEEQAFRGSNAFVE